MILIFFVAPLWGREEQRVGSYPLASANMAGEGYKILAGSEIITINVIFKNKIDGQALQNLRQEIWLNSVYEHKGSPKIYLVGHFLEGEEQKFIASSWYITTPFYEVNSTTEGLYDPQKTKERNRLTASDFNKRWLVNEIVDGRFVSSIERPKVDWSKYQKVVTSVKKE